MSANQSFRIELAQEDISIRFDLVSRKKVTISRIAGTAAKEAIRLLEVYREAGVKTAFKFHKPFAVRFSTQKRVAMLDTKLLLDASLQQKLKLTNNAKSKRNFAKNLYAFLTWATRDVQFIEASEVINDWNKEVELLEA